jgi:hypothetical protein
MRAIASVPLSQETARCNVDPRKYTVFALRLRSFCGGPVLCRCQANRTRRKEDLEMTTKPAQYRAYLLRLWNANRSGPPAWRASLEDTRTGERWGFANLERLYTFLGEQIGRDSSAEDDAAPAAADP